MKMEPLIGTKVGTIESIYLVIMRIKEFQSSLQAVDMDNMFLVASAYVMDPDTGDYLPESGSRPINLFTSLSQMWIFRPWRTLLHLAHIMAKTLFWKILFGVAPSCLIAVKTSSDRNSKNVHLGWNMEHNNTYSLEQRVFLGMAFAPIWFFIAPIHLSEVHLMIHACWSKDVCIWDIICSIVWTHSMTCNLSLLLQLGHFCLERTALAPIIWWNMHLSVMLLTRILYTASGHCFLTWLSNAKTGTSLNFTLQVKTTRKWGEELSWSKYHSRICVYHV